MQSLPDIDPGNQYLVPYMWGTTGFGYNGQVKERWATSPGQLGPDLRPRAGGEFADCGIPLLDDPTEVYSAALDYMGKDPNSRRMTWRPWPSC